MRPTAANDAGWRRSHPSSRRQRRRSRYSSRSCSPSTSQRSGPGRERCSYWEKRAQPMYRSQLPLACDHPGFGGLRLLKKLAPRLDGATPAVEVFVIGFAPCFKGDADLPHAGERSARAQLDLVHGGPDVLVAADAGALLHEVDEGVAGALVVDQGPPAHDPQAQMPEDPLDHEPAPDVVKAPIWRVDAHRGVVHQAGHIPLDGQVHP